jgi:energy-converting hydrogenase Eha subunit A
MADVPRTDLDRRPPLSDPGTWWTPRRATWWIIVLFTVGSLLFFLAPFPGFVQLFGSAAAGIAFFTGSVLFTVAALIQCVLTIRDAAARTIDWVSSAVLLAGTVFFDVNTFRALQTGLDHPEYNRLVWAPNLLGSICFVAWGYLAFVQVCGGFNPWPRHRTRAWTISAIFLVGCVAFGVSAIASRYVSATGSVADLAAANISIVFGALCFIAGGVMELAGIRPADPTSPSGDPTPAS